MACNQLPDVAMDTEPETDPAQWPPSPKAVSDEQLAVGRPRSSTLKSLIAKKVREVKEVGQRLSKLNKHLSTSDQLAAAKLLSFSHIDPEGEVPRLVRTNAFKVTYYRQCFTTGVSKLTFCNRSNSQISVLDRILALKVRPAARNCHLVNQSALKYQKVNWNHRFKQYAT